MLRHLNRTASWVLVVVVLASSFAAILGTATAASTTYALTGFVDQPGGATAPPVPAGVTVDLVSRATGQVFTTTVTGSGGQFAFTTSGTSGALVPGYWGLYVPPAGNISLTGCKHCGVLPLNQTPSFKYYSAATLTNANDTQLLTNVSVLPYVATLNGTVKLNGSGVSGASVKLLSPKYAGFSLIGNTTNATGFYNLSVPEGTFLLQTTYTQGAQVYTNSTTLTISSTRPPQVNPVLAAYSLSGRIYSSVTNSYVTVPGNATLFDATSHDIYSQATAPGGYYAFATYPSTFDVILTANGFQPAWFAKTVTTATPITQKVTTPPLTAAEKGAFDTVLNFSTFSPTTGKGTLAVKTSVLLGNDSVVPGLPNASVGQLWAQLGLDFNHTLTFPSTENASFQAWVNSQGPFFPAIQAGTTINGTGFYNPSPASPQSVSGFKSCPAAACGLASAATTNYTWSTTYTLNGTTPKNATSYILSFGFGHPASPADVYNYTVVLPADYVLSAGTSPPAQTRLIGKGPENTWTSFTLQSNASTTPSATATFTIVRQANLTANVAVSSNNSTFTSANVLNDTHDNYTVVLGVGMNATFSSAPTIYPSGQNGTKFTWVFGDGNTTSLTNVTTNHTYTKAGTYKGTLTVLSSAGVSNSTTFNVSVLNTVPKTGIASNSSAYENRTAGSTHFLFVNWTTTLHFNATLTLPSSLDPNKLSIAQYTLKAKNYTTTANFSTAKGANPLNNWTVAFGVNSTNSTTSPGRGLYVNFSNVEINGSASGLMGWGWIYNLTLEVWTIVGTNSTSHLTILVNDTQKPVPKISLDGAAGKAITNSSVVEGADHYAVVRLNASGSTDYGNGSIVGYKWIVNNTNTSTTFKNFTWTNTSVRPGGQLPTLRLGPKSTDYKINLTVTDKNGNKANATVSLEVAQNTTLRPLMEANNLTGPTSVNAGTSYTVWVNITVGGGSKSVAKNVSVSFYLLSPSGTGSKKFIGGAPGSVVFYGYTGTGKNATVNSTPLSTGVIQTLKYNKTVRAVLHWSPSTSGSFLLYANATAENQFVNGSSTSVASMSITVHPNPTTQLLEYGGIAAGVVVVIALLYLFYRRRNRKPGTAKPSSSSKSGLERTAKRSDDDDE